MIYLTVAGSLTEAERLDRAGIGVMLTPASGTRLTLVAQHGAWAADNGCFSRGDSFSLDAYLSWLASMRPAAGHCLFATAPDVVGDAAATWERSRAVLPVLRQLGYKAALVAQDGWHDADWGAFDALFIGGTDEFKLGDLVRDLIAEARQRGKWVHIGRVNSWQRLARFAQLGADSSDGTTLAFSRHRYLSEVCRWGYRLRYQRPLWAVA